MNHQEPWKSLSGRIALATAFLGAVLSGYRLASVKWFDWGIPGTPDIHVGFVLFHVVPGTTLLVTLAFSLYRMCGSPPEDQPARRGGALLGMVTLWFSWYCVANQVEVLFFGVGRLALWLMSAGLLGVVSWFANDPTFRPLLKQLAFITAIPSLGMLGLFLGQVLRRAVS